MNKNLLSPSALLLGWIMAVRRLPRSILGEFIIFTSWRRSYVRWFQESVIENGAIERLESVI